MATNDKKPAAIKPADKKPEKKADKKPDKKVAEKKASRFNLIRYLHEVQGELKKLVWPTRKDLISRTGAVFVFVIVVAILIGVLDLAFSQGISLIAKIGA